MIQLGQKVKDVITGAVGVAIARTEWLYGCIRITFQPARREDGKVPDTICVDEGQLEAVVDAPPIVPPADLAPAGDRPDPAPPAAPTR